MTEDYIKGYKDGFMSALGLKENFKCQIFGMEARKVLNILSDYVMKEELQKGVPIGLKFPYSQYDEWNKCCDALREQGWEIKKK